MKSDFLLAITQLSAEKNLSREVVIGAVEAALVSAYRKDSFTASQNVDVKINPATGKVQVWAEKTVVDKVSDSRAEISPREARKIKPDIKVGELIMVEDTPVNAGRIAAQTAKQVILQRLHEAEHSAILEEYAGREGTIINGIVQRIEPRQMVIDLGRTEAVLPANDQVPGERYRMGQRIKAVILEVAQTAKGPRVVLSRSHPDFLRRLFETEVPEIAAKTVELKSIAREAGSRSKVAVGAVQEGVDPVGCCVGLRGIRIQNIVNELSGEKIDVVKWSPDPAVFIANALSPAQIVGVELGKGGVATAIVPDRQLSLAIGREGQNVRLAAKLTLWRIDIKSASAAEAEKAVVEAQKAAARAAAAAEEEAKAEAEVKEEVPVQVAAEKKEEVGEEAEPEPVLTPVGAAPAPATVEAAFAVPPIPVREAPKPRLRFAEEILAPPAPTKEVKTKKKKKKSFPGREGEEVAGSRKPRRGVEVQIDEDEDY